MAEEKSNTMMQVYLANMRLMQRLGGSLQAAGMQWSQQGQTAATTAAAEFSAELGELLNTKDFPGLLALQLNIVRRHWDQNQALLLQAFNLGAQNPELAAEFREAFGEWKQELAGITSEAGSVAQALTPWTQYLAQFQQLWNPEGGGAAAKGKPGRK
ncbi:MAG TPA: hypothetical protein VGC69_05250 [Bordetella sp.]